MFWWNIYAISLRPHKIIAKALSLICLRMHDVYMRPIFLVCLHEKYVDEKNHLSTSWAARITFYVHVVGKGTQYRKLRKMLRIWSSFSNHRFLLNQLKDCQRIFPSRKLKICCKILIWQFCIIHRNIFKFKPKSQRLEIFFMWIWWFVTSALTGLNAINSIVMTCLICAVKYRCRVFSTFDWWLRFYFYGISNLHKTL